MAQDARHVKLTKFLLCNPEVEFVRYQWVDYTGILRARVITRSHCVDLSLRSLPLAMSPVAMTSTTINEFMRDLIATGVDHIYPDFSSLRVCFYAERHASVMCFVFEGSGNVGFSRCPRTILSNLIVSARKTTELEVGFELEFMCLNPDGSELVDCLIGWSTAAGLRNRCIPIIENLILLLQKSGIEVQQFHTEGPRGMFEISTGPLPPLEAVDALIYTREAVKTLFAREGVIATCHPSPQKVHYGVGAHIHISVAPGTDSIANAFLEGMLSRLPAVCAFSLPLEDSYKRVNDFMSEAGAYVAWGTENRDVPIRKIRTGHWELRCCDGAANMYLALAAFIAAGIQGLKDGKELPWQDIIGCPSTKNENERVALGIERKLPTNLTESLAALDEVDWDESGMKEAVSRYAMIKRHELTSLKKLSDDEQRALLIRLF
jgi:glutamine synthetase